MPKLIDNADRVLKRAWSVRLLGVGAVLNAGAIVLPLMVAAVPPSLLIAYGAVTFLVIVGAGLARFVKQDGISQDSNQDSGEP